eukprot:5900202-Prymnesium_polylepis.1
MHPQWSARAMRWPESSRIDPAIAADGETGRCPLSACWGRLLYYTYLPWARPRGTTGTGLEAAREA